LHKNGGTGAIIARIGRVTDGAIASDHGYALRSAGTEEGEGKLRVVS
jgi:hypothetical protein